MLISKLHLENLLSIDKLHYKEVQIINDLHDLVLSGNHEAISKKLDELVTDVEHHFEEEEKQMYTYGYSKTNAHQYAHGCALDRLYQARDTYKKTQDKKWLQDYLEKWLVPWFNGHVMTLDKQACDYMCEQWSN